MAMNSSICKKFFGCGVIPVVHVVHSGEQPGHCCELRNDVGCHSIRRTGLSFLHSLAVALCLIQGRTLVFHRMI